jgi:predicted nuclease of predicted toxin-antitoxin system
MKILLDECVTKKLKRLLEDYEVYTVTEMGWNGLKNGKLLQKAAEQSFDILLTIDKNIDSQQNISTHNLSLVILDVAKSNLKHLEPLIPAFIAKIEQVEKGKSYVIESNQP